MQTLHLQLCRKAIAIQGSTALVVEEIRTTSWLVLSNTVLCVQGEVIVVEEKPALSLLDKIRGKRPLTIDVPSPAATTKRSSFDAGQLHARARQ